MIKVSEHLSRSFKPLDIYYDDIVEICDILNNKEGKLTIEADKYIIENVEEILTIKKPFFTNLKITQSNPYVSFDCNGRNISIYASEDTDIQRGMYEKLNTILKPKERYIKYIFQSWISGPYTGASSYWFFFTDYAYIGIVMLLSGLVWSYIGHKSQTKYYSIILPIYKMNKSNFFKRNVEAFVVGLIILLISLIATPYMNSLLNKGN